MRSDSFSINNTVHLSSIDLPSIRRGLAAEVCPLWLFAVVQNCEWCSKLSICSISDRLRDVISHSMLALIKWPRRHGSITKASSSFLQHTESDRPIRARRWDTQSAVITALRGEEPARRQRASRPDQIHLQANRRSQRSCCLCVLPKLSKQLPFRIVRATHHPEGSRAQIRLRQVDCPRLVRVGDLHHLERVCGLPKSSQARFLWEKLYDSILLEYRHGDTAGGREADSNLSDDIKRGIQGVTHPHHGDINRKQLEEKKNFLFGKTSLWSHRMMLEPGWKGMVVHSWLLATANS